MNINLEFNFEKEINVVNVILQYETDNVKAIIKYNEQLYTIILNVNIETFLEYSPTETELFIKQSSEAFFTNTFKNYKYM